MTAKNLHGIDEKGIYYHVYNKGIESRIIFADEADYQVFLGYLEEYLSTKKSHENTKQEFTVNGRVFRGVPHQPKNYFKKVELLAYSLKPDHFHLLLHEITQKSQQGFLRSLCTRYSIYFNKKYNRTGSLFEGPYKSAIIEDKKSLLLLTRYIHKTGDHSSYPEYLGEKETPWVRTKDVLSIKDAEGKYKYFVEKHGLDQQEKALLESVAIDFNKHLERRDLAEVKLKPWSRFPELAAAFLIFVALSGFGLRNITASAKGTQSSFPITLGAKDTPPQSQSQQPSPSPKSYPQPKIILRVINVSEPVNIRKEPAVESAVVGKANGGETFEVLSQNSDWYRIKLPDGAGFISSQFVEKEEAESTIND